MAKTVDELKKELKESELNEVSGGGPSRGGQSNQENVFEKITESVDTFGNTTPQSVTEQSLNRPNGVNNFQYANNNPQGGNKNFEVVDN